METRGVSREQLVAQIEVLNRQVMELRAEQEKNKAALQESNKRFGSFIQTVSIGLIITNAQGDIVNANKAIQNMLGFSIDASKITNIADFYADSSKRDLFFELLQKSNRVHNFEAIVKHSDGTLRNVLINSEYIEMDHEKILLTSIYDITRLKKRQEELQEAEKEYHLFFSNAPIGITVTDFQGNLTVSNQAIQELVGYTAEELKTISVVDFYVNVAERYKLLELTKENGVVRDFEVKFKHKDGHVITVLINTDLIEYRGQNNVLLTSIRDITNLKQIEEALRKERDFTTAILNTTASLMMVLDRNGMIVRFNRACEEIAGFSFQEVRGKYIWDTLAVDSEKTKERVERLQKGENPDTHESILISKNGSQHLISWTDTEILDTEGKLEYIIATGIDITEKRKAEIELQIANQKLVSWVDELEKRRTELSLLSEMVSQLQSCQTIDEASAISSQYIQKICPQSQGALYLINPSKDLAEAAQMWGNSPSTEEKFLPLSCWAVRRARQHLIDDSHPGLLCAHITGPKTGQYLCVPMLVNGEALGILHLNNTTALENNQKETTGNIYNEHKVQLIMTIADNIALNLSNLKLRETLRQQSIRDILTGLFNRRYMEESLERELHRAEREKIPVGLIMFDIDHFKEFNDLSGHDGGDALLRELGVFLKKSIRGGDIVCRFGGEEFVAVLPGADLEETRLRAEELRKGVKKLLVYHLGKLLGKCTISLGVAVFPEHGFTRDELLKNADDALYRAKNEGRDRVVVS